MRGVEYVEESSDALTVTRLHGPLHLPLLDIESVFCSGPSGFFSVLCLLRTGDRFETCGHICSRWRIRTFLFYQFLEM